MIIECEVKNMSDFSKEIANRIRREDIINLTLDLVKIRSETGTEQQVQMLYADYLEKAGMELFVQPVDVTGRSNIIGKISGSGKGRSLMIQGHLDTISGSNCIQPYFNKEENRVYGRGSCDCKGQCALAAVAGKAIVESGVKLGGDLYIVGAVGEEGGPRMPDGNRWKIGAQTTVEKGFPAVNAIVVLEAHPPLGLAVTNKGSMSFEFSIIGADRQLHSVVAPLNRNPLFWQAEVIAALGRLNQEFSKMKHPYTTPPFIQLSAITYPEHSGVPMSCTIRGGIRVNPGDTKNIVEKFEALLKQLRSQVPLEINMTVGGEPLFWEVSPSEPVVRSFEKAFKEVVGKDILVGGGDFNADSRWFSKGTTEWHNKYNPKGITTIAFGPEEYSLHSNLEYIDVDQQVTSAKVLALAALDYCGTL
jgi:acetylornithine deacetylase/succinyl-diaminopimelate desuccinylase-like protein